MGLRMTAILLRVTNTRFELGVAAAKDLRSQTMGR